jgi:hypothetical protein
MRFTRSVITLEETAWRLGARARLARQLILVSVASLVLWQRGENIEGGLSRPTTAEELRTILVHLFHHTPFR